MSNQTTSDSLMEKAERAYLSARALIELGDADGACNRAYYAMFDAAKATLLALVDGPHIGVGKRMLACSIHLANIW